MLVDDEFSLRFAPIGNYARIPVRGGKSLFMTTYILDRKTLLDEVLGSSEKPCLLSDVGIVLGGVGRNGSRTYLHGRSSGKHYRGAPSCTGFDYLLRKLDGHELRRAVGNCHDPDGIRCGSRDRTDQAQKGSALIANPAILCTSPRKTK